MKQFTERGLDKAGIKLIGDGGVTDDDLLNDDGRRGGGHGHVVPLLGRARLGAQQEVRRRPSVPPTTDMRPNFMAVGGYDGMRVIYKALEATKGKGGGEALIAAMKGQTFESPRGPDL